MGGMERNPPGYQGNRQGNHHSFFLFRIREALGTKQKLQPSQGAKNVGYKTFIQVKQGIRNSDIRQLINVNRAIDGNRYCWRMLIDTCSKVTIIGTIETKPTKEIINVEGVMGCQTPAFRKIGKIAPGDKKLLKTVMPVPGL